MSSVFYYSNYCESSKKILAQVSKSQVKEDIHFICVDKRVTRDGVINIILENQEVILPPTVTKVPALLLLDRGYEVLFGNQILQHLQPINEEINNQSTQFNGEPHAFSLTDSICNVFGVASDNYSFLDQSSEDLSAKGSGGMRQQHHYAAIQHVDKIETPPDNYEPDTIKGVSMESLQKQRELDYKNANSK